MQQLALALDERTPHRPYCTDDLRAGLRIRTRRAALRLPYIQANPPHLRFWMLHDIDRPGGALAWEDAGLPPPAWAAINRDNMHAHLAWGLSAPVLTGDAGRAEPIRYLCAIESAYRAALDADPGYSGLITKNPLHERWQVLDIRKSSVTSRSSLPSMAAVCHSTSSGFTSSVEPKSSP